LNDLQPVKVLFDAFDGSISEEQYNAIVKEIRMLRNKIVA